MSQTNYLVTGANRGIGQGLVSHYLSQANNVVIAGVRNPQHESSRALSKLPAGPNSKLIIVKLDSAVETDAAEAISTLASKYDITTLDVVLANAGIARLATTNEVSSAEVLDHVTVNALGPLKLFQATHAALERSTKNPRFVVTGTLLGSITSAVGISWPVVAYGASKAMAQYITRKIHGENEWLTALSIHPGLVQTDMGNGAAKAAGLEQAETSIEDSVAGMVSIIDTATRETGSGPLLDFRRKELPW